MYGPLQWAKHLRVIQRLNFLPKGIAQQGLFFKEKKIPFWVPTVSLLSLWLSPFGASRSWGQLVRFLMIFYHYLATSKCGKNSSITLLTPNKNFSHFHPLNNKERKVMIVEFYWLYLNRLLLPQQYCATTIKLFWHITLNISAWTCQLCTSGAAARCQELLVTLRSLFTMQRIEKRASEPSRFQRRSLPCPPAWMRPGLHRGQLQKACYQPLEAWGVLGKGELSFPWF